MSSKKILIALFVVGFLLIATVVGTFLFLTSRPDPTVQNEATGEMGGLMNPDNVMEPEKEVITQDDIDAENEQKEDFNDAVVSQLYGTIRQKLSVGDFDTLDGYLADLLTRYDSKLNTEEQDAISYTMEINNYRADLATIKGLDEYNGSVMFASFKNPISCAAAIIYTDIDVKMDAFLDMDSKIYNRVMTGTEASKSVNLQEAELTLDEKKDLLQRVNEIGRTKGDSYVDVKGYDCVIKTIPYRIVVVQDSFYQWRPYYIKSDTNADSIVKTAYELKKLKETDPTYNFDMIDYDVSIDGSGTGSQSGIETTDPNTDPSTPTDPTTPSNPTTTPTDPNTGTTQPSTEPTDPNPPETTTPELSEADKAVVADLQKIMDSYDVNTTSLDVIQNTINQVKALAARPGISAEMKSTLDENITKLQEAYDKLDAILNS